jgi:hypothetical protein
LAGTSNAVQIKIYTEPTNPNLTLSLTDVPWYAGITALQAMMVGDEHKQLNTGL